MQRQRIEHYLPIPTPANGRLFVSAEHEQLAHAGREKMRHALKRKYQWPNMDNTITQVLLDCIQCMEAKSYKTYPLKVLHLTNKGHHPFATCAIDLAPSLPLYKDGDFVLVVAVDCFSKWTELVKLSYKEPELVAGWFEQEILSRYGVPNIIRTDNGLEFEGEFQKMLDTYS